MVQFLHLCWSRGRHGTSISLLYTHARTQTTRPGPTLSVPLMQVLSTIRTMLLCASPARPIDRTDLYVHPAPLERQRSAWYRWPETPLTNIYSTKVPVLAAKVWLSLSKMVLYREVKSCNAMKLCADEDGRRDCRLPLLIKTPFVAKPH